MVVTSQKVLVVIEIGANVVVLLDVKNCSPITVILSLHRKVSYKN